MLRSASASPTTYGAEPFRDRVPSKDAAVVERARVEMPLPDPSIFDGLESIEARIAAVTSSDSASKLNRERSPPGALSISSAGPSFLACLCGAVATSRRTTATGYRRVLDSRLRGKLFHACGSYLEYLKGI